VGQTRLADGQTARLGEVFEILKLCGCHLRFPVFEAVVRHKPVWQTMRLGFQSASWAHRFFLLVDVPGAVKAILRMGPL
jgi:hypothetical protein